MKYFMFLLSFMFLASCSSLQTKKDCLQGNWFELGKKDAKQGLRRSNYKPLAQACTEYGASTSKDQYMAGYQEGLRDFCKPENAFLYGSRGKDYKNTCPMTKASDFIAEYQKGKKVYNIERQLNRLQAEIDRLNQQMVSSNIRAAKKSNILQDLREKERKKMELQKRLSVLQPD